MELRQLTTFRMVASTLSFSRTAQALNYVQSSVTTQIQVLEEELGVKLFDRMGKRIALTEAGRRLLVYAEKILALSEEAIQVVPGDGVPSGTLVVGAAETLCTYRLPKLLRLFHKSYPQVKIVFQPLPSREMQAIVLEGDVDVAFEISSLLRSPVMEIEPLIHEPLIILVAPDHHLASKETISGQDLKDEPLLLTEVGCSYRVLLEAALEKEGVHATSNVEFNSIEAIKQCVMASMGIAFLPLITVKNELEQGKLVQLNWPQHEFNVFTQMWRHKDKWVSPTLDVFMSMAREVLCEREQREIAV